jgi:hypothetical protein
MAKYSEGRGGHFKGKPGTAAGILERHPVPCPEYVVQSRAHCKNVTNQIFHSSLLASASYRMLSVKK